LQAIDLPGSKQTFNVIQKRIDATPVKLGPDGRLQQPDMKRIVDQVEAYYPP
jgi:hypothetical protein